MEFLRIPRHGYYVEYGEHVDPGPYRHYFCGENCIPGAHCPNCDKPLLLMLNLDTTDPRLELTGFPSRMLPLLYCWTCDIAQDPPFCYRVLSDGSVELVRFGKGRSQPDDFPYAPYPVFFPGSAATLRQVPADVEEAMQWYECGTRDEALEKRYGAIVDRVYDDWTRHQVGGIPMMIQCAVEVKCQVCGQPAPLLAAIADNTTDDRGFVANAGVQSLFHVCLACASIHAYSEFD